MTSETAVKEKTVMVRVRESDAHQLKLLAVKGRCTISEIVHLMMQNIPKLSIELKDTQP